MKLGKTVLLEIVSILQDGLLNGTDISQRLREIDLCCSLKSTDVGYEMTDVELTQAYIDSRKKE